jgi:hypothetical protein
MMLSGPTKGRRRSRFKNASDHDIATAEIKIRGKVYPCPVNHIHLDRFQTESIQLHVDLEMVHEDGDDNTYGLYWYNYDFPMESLQLDGNILRLKSSPLDWDDPDGTEHFTIADYTVILTPKGMETLAAILAHLTT